MNDIAKEHAGTFWGISVCFNPAGYKNKYEHLKRFAQRIRQQGLKLLVVELAFGDAPFGVDEGDADQLIRLRCETVLWQKERLLNIALQALPPDCDRVAWLDADILFENNDWVAQTAKLLDKYAVVQPFDVACWLPRGTPDIPAMPDIEMRTQEGSGYLLNTRPKASSSDGHRGFAWAANRSLLQHCGFYDRFILGSGDSVMFWAMLSPYAMWPEKSWMDVVCPPALIDDMRQWADAFYLEVQGSIGYTPGRVFHLWHGDKKNRKYATRLMMLRETGFNPAADIALDEQQCWRWNSDKPELHRRVREYFEGRREEG